MTQAANLGALGTNAGTTGILASTGGGTGTTAGVTGFKNRIINGAMVIDQRNNGASVSITSGTSPFTVDRFFGDNSSAGLYTIQQSSIAPTGFTKSIVATVSTADTSIGANDYAYISQPIECTNMADLGFGSSSAKSITISFWARSSVTGTYCVNVGNNAANRFYVAEYSISVANTWEYKTVTIVGDQTGTWPTDSASKVRIRFGLAVGSNFQQAAGSWGTTNAIGSSNQVNWLGTVGNTFYITGVQLEVGSTATSFDYRPYGTELALCQRYYETGITGAGSRSSDNYGVYAGVFKVTKRANPTVTYVATGAAGGLGGYYLGPNTDGFVGYSTSATAGSAYYFTYTAAIEL